MTKAELRNWAKAERKKLDMEKISSVLRNKLVKTPEYINAKNIMIFYPLENEINLLPLLKDSTKNFYLPRINGEDLDCCSYKEGDALSESRFHTKEPVCKACDKTKTDMVVVPALMCDKNNYRLGYGGGFYDRFLRDYKGKKIVCIPKELITETVYPETFDVKMDLIIYD